MAGVERLLDFSVELDDLLSPEPEPEPEPELEFELEFEPEPEPESLDEDPLVEPFDFLFASRLSVR